jgi:hypothetical protein
MSKTDDNLISFTGDVRGNVWRNGKHIYGPDVPEHDVPPIDRHWIEPAIVLPPNRKIADTLKFSGVRSLVVEVEGVVPGGYEDCVDVNNECRNLVVRCDGGFISNGKFVFTVKGGSREITIIGPILVGGKRVDAGLGDWSDQSKALTKWVVLQTPRKDGKPTTYYQMNAAKPGAIETTLKCIFRVPTFLRPLWVWGHGLLKKLGVPV